jgi:hypothetical protein
MSEIHYFPRYTQRENFVTNNTLLLLLRLREFNRFKFEKYMEILCADADEEIELPGSWLQFQQQIGTGKSVVDGFIAQDSIKIAIETKLGDTFDLKQIENHLKIFTGEQHKILILLSSSQGELSKHKLEPVIKMARKQGVQILPLIFQDIIDKAKQSFTNDEEMLVLIDDYESFCSDIDLLPRDQFTLFVPPCGQSYSDNLQYLLYYCPTAWNRRKAKYIGIYKEKSIRAIGQVAKIVSCNVDLEAKKVAVPTGSEGISKEEEERILGATSNADKHGWDLRVGHKFYLFDSIEETDFHKKSSGGIMGHRYFDLEEVLDAKPPDDLAKLAALLRQHTWK